MSAATAGAAAAVVHINRGPAPYSSAETTLILLALFIIFFTGFIMILHLFELFRRWKNQKRNI